jgi:hypothetical protein
LQDKRSKAAKDYETDTRLAAKVNGWSAGRKSKPGQNLVQPVNDKRCEHDYSAAEVVLMAPRPVVSHRRNQIEKPKQEGQCAYEFQKFHFAPRAHRACSILDEIPNQRTPSRRRASTVGPTFLRKTVRVLFLD